MSAPYEGCSRHADGLYLRISDWDGSTRRWACWTCVREAEQALRAAGGYDAQPSGLWESAADDQSSGLGPAGDRALSILGLLVCLVVAVALAYLLAIDLGWA